MPADDPALRASQQNERESEDLLAALDDALEMPMVVLSFIMLALFLVEISFPLPADWRRTFNLVQWLIWVTFVIEFAIKLALAKHKVDFVQDHWLMALSVVLPVLRVFRILRAAKAARSLSALRVVAVSNRTIRQLNILFERRRLHYLLSAVVAVTVISGAGIYFLERSIPGANITTFGDGVWWSAGTITTVGTELYPLTSEGRILAVLVMIFGVSVFGYVAGSLAGLFVNIDRSASAEPDQAVAEQLREQVKSLQEQLDRCTDSEQPGPQA